MPFKRKRTTTKRGRNVRRRLFTGAYKRKTFRKRRTYSRTRKWTHRTNIYPAKLKKSFVVVTDGLAVMTAGTDYVNSVDLQVAGMKTSDFFSGMSTTSDIVPPQWTETIAHYNKYVVTGVKVEVFAQQAAGLVPGSGGGALPIEFTHGQGGLNDVGEINDNIMNKGSKCGGMLPAMAATDRPYRKYTYWISRKKYLGNLDTASLSAAAGQLGESDLNYNYRLHDPDSVNQAQAHLRFKVTFYVQFSDRQDVVISSN